MFRMKKLFFCSLCLWLMSAPGLGGAQESKTSIHPQADSILRQMSEYLGGFQQVGQHRLGHSEINHFGNRHAIVLSDKHIGRFQVPVDDSLLVGVLNSLTDVNEKAKSFSKI